MNSEIIGLVAGIFTTGATIPQILKTYKLKEAKDISLFYFISLVFGIMLWLAYGIAIKSVSVITWNIIAITLNMTILGQKIYYDNKIKK
jgi:MtN3 and saliva related transmembrane protein